MISVTCRDGISWAFCRTLWRIGDCQILARWLSLLWLYLRFFSNTNYWRCLYFLDRLNRLGLMWDFWSCFNLSLSFDSHLPSLYLVLIDNELKCAILIIFKILEPIVKIIAEPLVRLNEMIRHSTILSCSFTICCVCTCLIVKCIAKIWWDLLAVRTFICFLRETVLLFYWRIIHALVRFAANLRLKNLYSVNFLINQSV